MFDQTDKARLFGLPPGVDFARVVIDGLRARLSGTPPDAMARVEIIVNTERMRRRMRAIFDAGLPGLLPQLRVLGEVAPPAHSTIPEPVAPLQRRLQLVQLVSGLLDAQPDLAPRAALFDLADSLAGMMDEMQGEGVTPDDIAALDVEDQSGHWQRALRFLQIVQGFMDPQHDAPDAAARQRRVAEALAEHWQHEPPAHPVLVVGSTGSRGATALLMRAVARLPQGAVILPGFDFDMTPAAWDDLSEALSSEDHPQFRFARLMRDLRLTPQDIQQWHDTPPPSPARNRLLSLALRPAPVTHAWLTEGPALRDLDGATREITLVKAQTRRDEAMAIALRLRQAAEEGTTAALITPDRQLTRQVTAALDQWGIVPDDSAGIPLQLSPPGRFLRHVADILAKPLSAQSLLALLKHPLCHTGTDRNEHLRMTRDLELRLRRFGPPFPDAEMLTQFAECREWSAWGDWLSQICDQPTGATRHLTDWLALHRRLAEALAAGTGQDGAGQLWAQVAGTETLDLMQRLHDAAPHGGDLNAHDYVSLFNAVLAREEQRDRDLGHPHILIWGTLEARVMGAELLILASLNEGSWPEPPAPDPWLNRKMRHDAGLLLPERRIGLSAHDFQQAIAAEQVWLTRSVRSDDAETVPSRWLNRLTNLLTGLGDDGKRAYAAMEARGARWLDLVNRVEEVAPVASAPRPSPQPPATARPRKLSVTEIKTLIRDPYAIYAKHVLRLKPLDPLAKVPDALLRGIIAHDVLEDFIRDTVAHPEKLTREHLLSTTARILAAEVPWPAARVMWQTRMDRIADGFISDETERRAYSRPLDYEVEGQRWIDAIGFQLICKADRIDRHEDGRLIVYDYKTGTPPDKAEQTHFDKQLLLETAIAESGGFKDIDPAEVTAAIYIGLGSTPVNKAAPLEETPTAQIWAEFSNLIGRYMESDQGYTARRAMQRGQDEGRYDQLARFGEWDTTAAPRKEPVA